MSIKPPNPARLVVLVSGTGSNLQALLQASKDPAYGAQIVAVGADRLGAGGIAIAREAGIPTFECLPSAYSSREEWDRALAEEAAQCASHMRL